MSRVLCVLLLLGVLAHASESQPASNYCAWILRGDGISLSRHPYGSETDATRFITLRNTAKDVAVEVAEFPWVDTIDEEIAQLMLEELQETEEWAELEDEEFNEEADARLRAVIETPVQRDFDSATEEHLQMLDSRWADEIQHFLPSDYKVLGLLRSYQDSILLRVKDPVGNTRVLEVFREPQNFRELDIGSRLRAKGWSPRVEAWFRLPGATFARLTEDHTDWIVFDSVELEVETRLKERLRVAFENWFEGKSLARKIDVLGALRGFGREVEELGPGSFQVMVSPTGQVMLEEYIPSEHGASPSDVIRMLKRELVEIWPAE